MTKPPFWISLMPAAWLSGMQARPHFRQVVGNIAWLMGDKLARMALGLLVGVFVARHLGPQMFGLLGYAAALVGLFGTLATLGMDSVVTRDLVRRPQDAGRTLGSSAVLQFLGAVAALVLSMVAVLVLRPADTLSQVAVAVTGSALLFKPADAIRFWFDSLVQARHTVRAEFTAFAVFSLAKVLLLLWGAGVLWFACVIPAEAALAAWLLVRAWRRTNPSSLRWRVDWQRARSLMESALPLVLAAVAAGIYLRIDQVMLGQYAGDHAVGIYTAATRLSEVWYFVPVAVCSSVFPALLTNRAENPARYEQDLEWLLAGLTVIAVAIALPLTLLAGPLMALLFGAGFDGAADVLVVHVWAAVFVFHGIAGGRWFLAEGLQRMMFHRTLAGCVLNVALNLVLIPRYGAVGAAWGTIAAQAMAAFVFNALNPRTRPLLRMQLRALSGLTLWRALRARHG